jgi:hypothetical protein
LFLVSILLGGVVGCVGPATQPAVLPTPTVPPGWERDSANSNGGQCSYAIDHPSNMDLTSQGAYSWILNYTPTEPGDPFPNFVYISVVPDDFQSDEPGIIYNYDPDETQTLLNMQLGEAKSLRDDPNLTAWFTYTRLPDITLDDRVAQTYENTQPWEFPLGTKEIRYYIQANRCTYIVGGYLATVGSGQTGAIDEQTFDRIIASFRLGR